MLPLFLTMAMALLPTAPDARAQTVPDVATKRGEPDWPPRHAALKRKAAAGGLDVVFLGDSITEYFPPEVLKERFGERAGAFGISGDRTEHLLWRIAQGELDGLRPRALVLLIGTNNLTFHAPPAIRDGIAAVVRALRKRLPGARILLMALLPRGQHRDDPLRKRVDETNRLLPPLSDGERVLLLNAGPWFLKPDGSLPAELMPDYLHPSVAGYRAWADAIDPWVRRALGKPR
jgi:lysophospholipase L1-like esterase